ncbi:glycosyltransferase family 61 protein [Calothrix membranacea FACHB-236]|nr:glycosyltransferase family 61 protein [Calothrix membranacea FACHB-236]
MIPIKKNLRKAINALHPQMPKGTISDANFWVEQTRKSAKADTMRGWAMPWVEELFEEQPIVRSKPNTLEKTIHPNFIKHYFTTTPRASVYILHNARIVGIEGYVISPDNKVFEEFTYCSTKSGSDYDIFYRLKLPQLNSQSGWWATITYPDASEFFHFEIESFPRLRLIEQFKTILDGLVVPKTIKKNHLKLLQEVGFGEERLIKIDQSSHIKFENLIVPAFVAGKNLPKWVPSFYKNIFFTEILPPSKLVYISREDAQYRRIINSDEVENLVTSFGFTKYVISELSPIQQREVFSSANIIVSPHGAALSNLVYSQKNLKLLEIFSPHHVDVTYWTMIQAIEAEYWYILGKQTPRNKIIKSDFENILVDIEELKNYLNIILQNA